MNFVPNSLAAVDSLMKRWHSMPWHSEIVRSMLLDIFVKGQGSESFITNSAFHKMDTMTDSLRAAKKVEGRLKHVHAHSTSAKPRVLFTEQRSADQMGEQVVAKVSAMTTKHTEQEMDTLAKKVFDKFKDLYHTNQKINVRPGSSSTDRRRYANASPHASMTSRDHQESDQTNRQDDGKRSWSQSRGRTYMCDYNRCDQSRARSRDPNKQHESLATFGLSPPITDPLLQMQGFWAYGRETAPPKNILPIMEISTTGLTNAHQQMTRITQTSRGVRQGHPYSY